MVNQEDSKYNPKKSIKINKKIEYLLNFGVNRYLNKLVQSL